MDRRASLRASAAVTLPLTLPGVADAATRSRQPSGIVWSHRDRNPGTQRLFDVLRGPDGGFTACGYGTPSGDPRTLVRVTDRWGRPESQRRGPEWGDRGHELVPLDGGNLLAGTDGDSPMLGRFADPSGPAWTRTYDGTPEGTVRAATTGDDHAVGWTGSGDTPDTGGVAVVGTDADGNERWSDRPGDRRRLVELLSAGADPSSLVAVGTRIDGPGGSATVWEPDGTQVRDTGLETPGDGPAAAVATGGAVTLAGTGEERWRGRYAPYAGSDGDGDEPADRGNAMVLVADDEFGLAGTTAPSEEGRDCWLARVGEPGAATPADVPDPTPTPPPTTMPSRTTAPPTGPTPTESVSPSPTPDTGTRTPASPTVSDGPGSGVLAALAGLSGWLAVRRSDD